MHIREVRPGLYERLDTPHHVKLDRAFVERVAKEANSPLLLAILEKAIEEQERRALLPPPPSLAVVPAPEPLGQGAALGVGGTKKGKTPDDRFTDPSGGLRKD